MKRIEIESIVRMLEKVISFIMWDGMDFSKKQKIIVSKIYAVQKQVRAMEEN